jgi:Bacterial Ig domain/FG-GAP repeat
MKSIAKRSNQKRRLVSNRTVLSLSRLECRAVPSSVVANDDFTNTMGNTAVTVDILGNDQAVGSTIDPATVNVVQPPSHGKIAVDGKTGEVTYTPADGFGGTDSFKYTVKDHNNDNSNPASASIVVVRPTANDDIMDTDGTNPVTIDVLANDTDPGGPGMLNPGTVTIVGGPQHGTFTIDSKTGDVIYTAEDGFAGTDRLTYTVKDLGGATSNTATITIVVNRPTANDDFDADTDNDPFDLHVLDNDTDPDGNGFLDPSSVAVGGSPAHGTAVPNPVTGVIRYTPAPNFTGVDTFTYTVKDFPGAKSNVATVRVRIDLPQNKRIIVAGSDAGGAPLVNIYNSSGQLQSGFNAFDSHFTGGVRVAVGDINGDGTPDIVAAAGAGGGPHVKIFNGANNSLIREFFAYGAGFLGGVNIATGDVNGDGIADIVTGAGAGGGPHVKVFDGKTGGLLREFFAYDASFRGGVNVAVGDVNGDGIGDIVTGAGASGGPHVKVFDGKTGNVIQSFFAYDGAFHGGVTVATVDINNDGYADVVTGAGASGGPHVKVFDAVSHVAVRSFFAFPATFQGGVRVAAGDLNADGVPDLIVSGGSGAGPKVRGFDGTTGATIAEFNAFDPSFQGGVYVGSR